MKKLLLSLLLVLALTVSSAFAEEVAYVPGAVTEALVNDAINAGKMVGGTLGMQLNLDPAAFGLEEKDAAQLQLLLDFLSQMRYSAAVGKIDGGFRVDMAGSYLPSDSRDFVSVDLSILATVDGLCFQSDTLLPEKLLMLNTADVIAALGLDEDTSSMVLAALHGDEEAIGQLAAVAISAVYAALDLPEDFDIEATLNAFMAELANYGAIIGDWAGSLEVTADETQVEGCEKPFSTVSVTIRPADIGNLGIAIANQLEQDKLMSMLVEIIANSSVEASINPAGSGISVSSSVEEHEADETVEPITCAEICEGIRAIAQPMIDSENQSGLCMTFGGTEDGSALIFALSDTESAYVNATLLVQQGENPNEYLFNCSASVMDFYKVIANGTVVADPEDSNVVSLSYDYSVFEGETEVMHATYAISSDACTTEENLPGYAFTLKEDVMQNVTDWDEAGTEISTAASANVTADGLMCLIPNGEGLWLDCSMTVNADEQTIPMTLSYAYSLETVSGELTGGEAFEFVLPEFMSFTIHEEIFSYDQDSMNFDTLEAINVLSLSDEEMSALTGAIAENFTAQISKAMELMPEELVQLIGELFSAM